MPNNQEGHFAYVPQINIERSQFPLNQNHKTSFDVGQIIPIFTYTDVLPGDTFKVSLSQVVRLATPLTPTMDNLFLDIYAFADRTRNTWIHFPEFMGENNSTAWYSSTEYNPPKWINSSNTSGYANKTYYDYMGLDTIQNKVTGQNYTDEVLPNAFALRSLIRIYNYFFRDENVIAPITEDTSDNNVTLDTSDAKTGGVILKASRFHDYFSSCLPGPQKGAPISIPLGTQAPLTGYGKAYGTGQNIGVQFKNSADPWDSQTGGLFIGDSGTWGKMSASTAFLGQNHQSQITPSGPTPQQNSGVSLATDPTKSQIRVDLSSVYADLSNAIGASVNALRLSVQTQKILEADARRGTRFEELINGHFNVTLLNQKRPELLASKRIPIAMSQVPNTTGTSDAPQGHLSAYSQTVDTDYLFTKSFTEWSNIIIVAVVRAQHTYSQGINRMWTRNHRLEYYWPELKDVGEMPVYNYQIFHQTPTGLTENNGVFGYQEPWAEYRYLPDICSAEMRPSYPQSLDYWHYADDYNSLPVLSQNWLEEPKEYVARTLAVKSHNQLIGDFNIHIEATRPMPVYSIPGYMDHF